MACAWGRAAEGLYPLVKPPGMTSHDVVYAVRRVLGEKHVGHAGTLDPAAAGVLLVLVGTRATRLAEYLLDLPKTYVAEVRFGTATDTQDYTGRVTARASPEAAARLDLATVEKALAGFRGEQSQVPPAMSAVQVGGERLYRLARQGTPVSAPARKVNVYDLTILDFAAAAPSGAAGNGGAGEAAEAGGIGEARAAGSVARLRVVASRGTYVRTLAHDLGGAVGVPAHLGFLVREAVGPYRVAGAATLEELTARAREGRLEGIRVDLALALAWLPAVKPPPALVARLQRGNPVPYPSGEGGLVRVLSGEGALLAIGSLDNGTLRPKKVLEPDWGK